MKPQLLLLITLPEQRRAIIGNVCDILYAPDQTKRAEAIASPAASKIQVVLTNGTIGLTAAEMDAMPALKLVCAFGAGHENIDQEYARTRSIAVATGAGTNDDCVADHAFGLLLAVVRDIPGMDRACRDGIWRDDLPIHPQVARRRLGIAGLGTIGKKIARRAAAFDMEIGYCNRTQDAAIDYAYFSTVEQLASWCDMLIVATPGGAATYHLIGEKELKALGKHGYLVNVARGSVVDTEALSAALHHGDIAGAGLDVYEGEPQPPSSLLDLNNVVLTPHMAGWSPQAVTASVDKFLEHVSRYLPPAVN